ncbi:hypothetical protein BHE75_01624 [Sphingomonas haloaromaticamans]|uniref:Uncharacterized protein n=1 Tax=Edaphosphingomonas haloaromaticamans TaxID=653954 RepID=A0A1S1HBW8_9SPHN|nr:hypothetical protein BHE75_01624 [Sphingomonas haloaromaticamans]
MTAAHEFRAEAPAIAGPSADQAITARPGRD